MQIIKELMVKEIEILRRTDKGISSEELWRLALQISQLERSLVKTTHRGVQTQREPRQREAVTPHLEETQEFQQRPAGGMVKVSSFAEGGLWKPRESRGTQTGRREERTSLGLRLLSWIRRCCDCCCPTEGQGEEYQWVELHEEELH